MNRRAVMRKFQAARKAWPPEAGVTGAQRGRPASRFTGMLAEAAWFGGVLVFPFAQTACAGIERSVSGARRTTPGAEVGIVIYLEVRDNASSMLT